MIFNRLVLKNFKSHEKSIIEFKKGITIITGENGAGKSSILEGISFALFKQHTSKKIDYLVRNNTNKMTVELEFIANNKEYKIIREKKTNLKSQIYKKENKEYHLICEGDKEVNNEISQILEMDSNFFLNAIYVRQGEISQLLEKGSSEKKALIAKLLGIDSLENSWKKILPFINNIEKKIIELKGRTYEAETLKEDYKNKKNELKNLIKTDKTIKKDQKTLKKDIEQLEKDKKTLEEKKQKSEKIQHKIEVINEKIILKKEKIEENTEYLEKIKGYEEEIKNLEGCSKKLEELLQKEKDFEINQKLIEEKNDLKEEIKKEKDSFNKFLLNCQKILNTNIETLQEGQEETEKQIKQTREKGRTLFEKIEEKQKNKISFEEKIKNSKNAIRKLGDVDSTCPICQSEITEEKKDKLVSEYNDKINGYNKSIFLIDEKILQLYEDQKENELLYEKLLELNYDIQNYHKLQENIVKNEEKLDNFKNISENFDENINEIKKKVHEMKRKNDKYNMLLGSIKDKNSRLEEAKTLKWEVNELENQVSVLENEFSEIIFDSNEYYLVCNNLDVKKDVFNENNQKLSKNKGESSKIIENLVNIQNKIDEFSKISYDIEKLSENKGILEEIRECYSKNGVQKSLRNISRPLIEKNTKDFFNEFNFNYSDLSINDEYDVFVYGPEGMSSMDMVSGGEKVAIALALRLGITQSLSKGKLNSILLDEPTIHLDRSKMYELVNLLRDVSLLPQMIIVTHESQLENAADTFIKVEKQNGISKIL